MKVLFLLLGHAFMTIRSFSPSSSSSCLPALVRQEAKRKQSSESVSFELPERKPKLIVFDLDATLWHPELYQLGSKVRAEKDIRLHSGAAGALKDLHEWQDDCYGAVASRTDRTALAESLLHDFEAVPGIKATEVLPYREIYPGSKRRHFRSLREKSGIPFSEMIFFDDWTLNLDEVAQLGVLGIHTPRGLTPEVWAGGLWAYSQLDESRRPRPDTIRNKAPQTFPPFTGSLVLRTDDIRSVLLESKKKLI